MSEQLDTSRLQQVLDDIAGEIGDMTERGEATTKIAALADIDIARFGIAVFTRDGETIAAGDADMPFSIQSISKVFSLELALEAYGDRLWERVGREPSGDPYNSIVDLELHEGIPRNPFMNAGALVVVDMLVSLLGPDEEVRAVIDFVAGLLEGDEVSVSEEVARSDEEAGDLNRALMSLARHFGNFENPIERVMRAYVHQCAIELSCRQLARVGRFLMLGGSDGVRDAAAARRARRIMALMMTCGQYDGSGDFAYRVGLPAKSGIGGGILTIVPNRASIGIWSPGLDQSGNSLLGTLALERLTDRVEWSVFGAIGGR